MKKNKWSDLRQEFDQLRRQFNFSSDEFQPVGLDEWKKIEEKIYHHFCQLNHPRARPLWLWERFKLTTYGVCFDYLPIDHLDKLIDKNETVWFMVNETVNEGDKFWIYEGKVNAVQQIINESYLFDEIYLISKKYEWLICINHHDCLIATGDKMPERLKMMEMNLKTAGNKAQPQA